MNKKLVFVFALIIALFTIGSVSAGFFDFLHFGDDSSNVHVDEDGQYCTVNEVAAYIKEYAPGKSIGGDTFTNRQHVLPDSDSKYIECDINANGTARGAERIVYNSGDFKVYYTSDHYNTFKEV